MRTEWHNAGPAPEPGLAYVPASCLCPRSGEGRGRGQATLTLISSKSRSIRQHTSPLLTPQWPGISHTVASKLQGRQERALGHICISQYSDKDLGTAQRGSTLFVLIPPETSPAGLCVFASAFGISYAGRKVKSLPISVTFYLETTHGSACLRATSVSGGSGR